MSGARNIAINHTTVVRRCILQGESLMERSGVYIPGEGPLDASIMLVGEAGGENEERLGRPFVGISGDDLTRYMSSIRLHRDGVFLTNLVKTRPPGNADPTPEMIAEYEGDLCRELATVRPRIVVPLGRFSTRWFLGPGVSMEREVGLPHIVRLCGTHSLPFAGGTLPCQWCHINDAGTWSICIIPIYHPAFGLYSHDEQPAIQDGWDRLAEILRVGIDAAMAERADRHPHPRYFELTDDDGPRAIERTLGVAPRIVSIDTEGSVARPWCLSVTARAGSGAVVAASAVEQITAVQRVIDLPTPVITHWLAHDWQVLDLLGIKLEWRDDLLMRDGDPWWRRFSLHDTTEIAYLLGPMWPQALKTLSYRVSSMEMREYTDLMAEKDRELAMAYLRSLVDDHPCEACRGRREVVEYTPPQTIPAHNKRVATKRGPAMRHIKARTVPSKRRLVKCAACDGDGTSWPKPESLVLWENGRSSVWQPEPVGKKARRIIADAEAGKPVDPRARWEKSDPPETREMVETHPEVGPMPLATLDMIDRDEVVGYAARDADATLRDFEELAPRIESMGLVDVYAADMAIIPLIVHMSQAGMEVDTEYFAALSREWRREMSIVAAQLRNLVGYYVNPGSHKQVENLLFVRLGLAPVKRTKSREAESTDDKVLEQLKIRSGHPAVDLIMRYRELSKLDGTYARPLSLVRSADRRVRTIFNTTRAKTGRLSSSKPKRGSVGAKGGSYIQLQNVPVRTVEGRRIREGIVAREGCLLGSWDLNQIEMRVMAHCSKDANLIRLFVEGAACPVARASPSGGKCNCHDIHRYTASLIWRMPIDEVSADQRASAKNVGFGIIYGITPEGLQTQFALRGIKVSKDEARALIESYLRDAYPGIRRYWEEKFAEARRVGYVRSESGRIRWATAAKCAASWVREAALRELANFPIQEYAAFIIKRIMARVWTEALPVWWRHGWDVRCLLQVHDDIVLEFPEGCEREIDRRMRRIMSTTVELAVPVGCEGKWGRTWADLKD